jgi:hypothetical protein
VYHCVYINGVFIIKFLFARERADMSQTSVLVFSAFQKYLSYFDANYHVTSDERLK